MKLDIRAAALAGAVLWSFVLGGVALIHTAVPDYGVGFLAAAGSLYPGFEGDGTLLDAALGIGWGLFDGAVCGALGAWVYNRVARPR
jgi:hypothetical protein